MEKIKIGNACDILNGFAFKSDQYVDEGIRVIRIANVQKGYIEDNTPAFYPLETKGIEKYMLDEEDLLVSLTGNVGRVAILEREMLPAALNQRVACLRLKTDKIEKGYLFHILNSDFFEKKCIQASNGVAQKNMSTEWLKEFSIPVYSKEEQKKITTILDKLRNVINIREKEIHSLDELIKARFVELFGNPVINDKGWSTDSCKKLMRKIGSGATPKGGRESYCDEGISLIRSMNVYNNRFEYKDLAHITDEQAEQLDNVTIEKSDVLLNITGASVARCCVVPDDLLPARVNQHVSIIRCKENLLPEFVCSMFTEDNYQRLLWNIATAGGATREAITKQEIEDLQLIVPPLDIQKQFMDFVKQVDKSKVAVQKALGETKLLFDSLMQEYFG